MTISTEAIKSALSALIDPVTGTDYVSGKMFKSAETCLLYTSPSPRDTR